MADVVEGDQYRRQIVLDLDDGQCAVEHVEPDAAPGSASGAWRADHPLTKLWWATYAHEQKCADPVPLGVWSTPEQTLAYVATVIVRLINILPPACD
jgi:hypothetical protein